MIYSRFNFLFVQKVKLYPKFPFTNLNEAFTFYLNHSLSIVLIVSLLILDYQPIHSYH